jgi:hypothetical protein
MEKKSPGKCPPLQMIYSSPRISLDDRHISSKVYTIEYKCKNAKGIIGKLKDTFTASTQFLMAKLRYTHPQSFANTLKMQSHIMKDTFVLPLINVSPDKMFYLQPELVHIPGVITIVSTRMPPTSCRYNTILIFRWPIQRSERQHHPKIYRHLQQSPHRCPTKPRSSNVHGITQNQSGSRQRR